MRKLIAETFVSLDGFMAGPDDDMNWFIGNFVAEMSRELVAHRSTLDTVLLGRVTYQMFASYWPDLPDTNPLAAHINHATKATASRTIRQVCYPSMTETRDGVLVVIWTDLVYTGETQLSVVTSKPASRGHFKTSHPEGGLVIGLVGV